MSLIERNRKCLLYSKLILVRFRNAMVNGTLQCACTCFTRLVQIVVQCAENVLPPPSFGDGENRYEYGDIFVRVTTHVFQAVSRSLFDNTE